MEVREMSERVIEIGQTASFTKTVTEADVILFASTLR